LAKIEKFITQLEYTIVLCLPLANVNLSVTIELDSMVLGLGRIGTVVVQEGLVVKVDVGL